MARLNPTFRRRDLLRLLPLLAATGPACAASPWSDAAGRPSPAARQAVALLEGAADDGLDPAAYDAAKLAQWLQATDGQDASASEAALQSALLRYLHDLHLGRVEPRSLGFGMPPRPAAQDDAALLLDAVAGGRLAEHAAGKRPALPAYAELRAQLANYRRLAAGPALPAFTPAATLRPGDRNEQLGALVQRLNALGDLQSAAVPALYEGELVDAVKRFQVRHGLPDDGAIGAATRAALAVPPSRRVRQIELALERLRWLPHDRGRRFVAVNIPAFRLWVRNPDEPMSGSPSMRVIVGKAMKHRTPVFIDEMRYLVFRPYWNVPRSIVRSETLPAIARDPGYLERQQMEIVRGPGDDAKPVPASAENIALLREGTLRVRQRPGPHNALGPLKFIFPNDDNIYLHGTPAQALFEKTRRDFSHGCIRLADPAALAEWVLRDQPGWTRQRIDEAMAGSENQRVDLKEPVGVLIFYLTALALPGQPVQFADDVYGHDAALERALGLPAA